MSYRKEYKPEIIRVRLSMPVLVRARCIHCGGFPTQLYYMRNNSLYVTPPRRGTRMGKRRYRMSTGHPSDSPKYFTMNQSSHSTMYKSYRPKLHRTRGSSSSSEFIEYLTCDCFATKWAFAEKSVVNRPEIMNRKARNFFPHKFEY